MPAPKFTSALAKEYSDLFNTCEANPNHTSEIEGIISRIVTFKDRYQAVTNTSSVPWYVIAYKTVTGEYLAGDPRRG
jgi:lysozyme family protein